MNQSEAADVAATMASFCSAEGDLAAEEKHAAAFEAAREHLLEGALTTLVQRVGDGAPMLLALKGSSLYLLTIAEPEEGVLGPPASTCEMLHVAPGVARVRAVARFRTRGSAGPAPRTTDWSFDFTEGPEISFSAHFHPDQREDGREELAQALARGLGWELPNHESPTAARVARL
jgi:hypothetical protein